MHENGVLSCLCIYEGLKPDRFFCKSFRFTKTQYIDERLEKLSC